MVLDVTDAVKPLMEMMEMTDSMDEAQMDDNKLENTKL